ncbi:cell division protein FtsQ/DivIB [Bifidobacterium simiiventris]|uniref:cell division protein FtsQ/DivIB n=1 Tax=Bifidobacterium simiiventris TaxID=2834434 RepID=UPI001C581D03|nr:FtsQ-type POTRA domain-containing protein [Bifidobacterium simiiventris]MBW3077743.1 FtsQ-type POTRA domain-containing protein [Bifidobacterium simiiventris]
MARRIISSHDEDGLPEPGTRRNGGGPRAVVSHAGTAGGTGKACTETSRRHGRTARSAASGGKPAGETSVRKGFVDMRRMPSEDVVAKTLNETAGVLGVPTRPKIVDFNARLKERRRLSLKVIAIRTAAALAALAAVSALIWLLFFSSVFRLETSRISVSGGNDWVSSSDILSIAGKQSGRSLLLVSTNDVASQLKNIPGVTEATVKKQFPNSLSVTVKAQQPAAMLKGPGNTMVAVDSQGRVLNQVGDASTDGIPTIDVANVERSLGSKAIKEALKVLGSLPDSLRSTITKVTADTQDSITTELNGGEHVVIWGDSSDLPLKQAIVDKILSDPNVIGDKKQVDVSAPSRPIIK